jgi:hypothetical protein
MPITKELLNQIVADSFMPTNLPYTYLLHVVDDTTQDEAVVSFIPRGTALDLSFYPDDQWYQDSEGYYAVFPNINFTATSEIAMVDGESHQFNGWYDEALYKLPENITRWKLKVLSALEYVDATGKKLHQGEFVQALVFSLAYSSTSVAELPNSPEEAEYTEQQPASSEYMTTKERRRLAKPKNVVAKVHIQDIAPKKGAK